jgi:4-amino-4-deoxy-L-arabinose transferase-like glycosyltransferase
LIEGLQWHSDGEIFKRLAFVGALALAARLAAVAATPGYRPVHDDASYARVARSLLTAGHYPGHPVPGGGWQVSAYRPPGWPVMLTALWRTFGTTVTGARVAEAAIGACAAVLVAVLARQAFGGGAMLPAGLVAALSPLAIAVGASLESETLFTALILGAACAAFAARRSPRLTPLIAAGALGGLAALTRANGLVAVPALALVAAAGAPSWRARAARFAVPVAVAALVVAPWTVRNAVELHTFVPVSTEVGNTLAGTYNPVSARHDAQWLEPAHTGAYHRVYARYGATAAADDVLTRAVAHWVERHPTYPADVAIQNGGRLLGFAGPGWAAWSMHTMSLGARGSTLVWLGVLVTTARAAAGAALARARAWPLWLLLLVLLVPAMLVNGELRLGAPAEALLCVFAGLAVSAIRGPSWPRPRRHPPSGGPP